MNWDSFKWRNYDYALGRFMSIDPLAEEYNYQSPYNFSENRVVDGRELEGLEWSSSIVEDEVHLNLKVQIVNTAGLSEKKINRLAEKIQNNFNKTYSQIDGYTASMEYEVSKTLTSDYTIEVVEQIRKPVQIKDNDGNVIGTKYLGGLTKTFADTQNNQIKVTSQDGEGKNRSNSSISNTVLHELGHGAGLPHPWETNTTVPSDINQNSGEVKNSVIRKNLMNSDGNPNESLRNSSGNKLTEGQMEFIQKTINQYLK